MLSDALHLARKDIRHMFRHKETWLWVFLMPVMFIYFIGTITGRGGGIASDPKDPIALVAPSSAGFLADGLARKVEAQRYAIKRVTSVEEARRYGRRLIVPDHFTEQALAGKPQKIIFERTGGGLSAGYDRVRLSRAVYTLLAEIAVLGDKATAESLDRLSAESRKLTLDVVSAGRRRKAPSGFEQAVPGNLVMFTLLVLFTTGAVTLTIERNQGILRRLASAPMSRGSVVLAKWLARMALGMIQITFAMIAGSALFRVNWGPNLPAIALLLIFWAGLAAALGMLLANAMRSEGQVIGVGVLSTNVLAALGGCWWPIEITPAWMQKLALALPTGWAMDALHKLVSFGENPVSVAPHLFALAAASLIAVWLAARRFRFQ